jgi:hypothetical protein
VTPEYARSIAELAGTSVRRAVDLAAADRAYADGVAAASAELRRAEVDAVQADRRAAKAASTVVDVDREVGRLWGELHPMRGWLRGRGRDLPEPVQYAAGRDLAGDEAASAALDRASREVDAAGRPARPRGPMPGWMPVLLPFVGATVAALLGLLSGGLVTLADLGAPGADMWRMVGWIAFLLAPLAGVPVASVWIRRRFGARLDTGAAGLIVLGGLVALCSVAVWA